MHQKDYEFTQKMGVIIITVFTIAMVLMTSFLLFGSELTLGKLFIDSVAVTVFYRAIKDVYSERENSKSRHKKKLWDFCKLTEAVKNRSS